VCFPQPMGPAEGGGYGEAIKGVPVAGSIAASASQNPAPFTK
jgi:hypothetical protein